MKILFIGDIIGRPGREAVAKILPKLKKEKEVEFVIANGENISHGKGMTQRTVEELRMAGVDFFTSGNHIWAQKRDICEKIDEPDYPVIRPYNYPEGAPGKGYKIIETRLMKKILIINLMGRVFIRQDFDCPFKAIDKILEEVKGVQLNATILDFHAEASSEKVAMKHYLDGRVSAIFGTHTHVPTADKQITPGGTAYITDAGMVGPRNSVIGAEKEAVLYNFLTQMPAKFEPADDKNIEFSGVTVEINELTGKAEEIELIQREIRLN